MKNIKNDSLNFLSKYLIITILLFISVFAISKFCPSNKKRTKPILNAAFLEENTAWADTLLKHMSIDEKISQLIFLELDTINESNFKEKYNFIEENNVGGVFFKNDSLKNYIKHLNSIQKRAKIPLLTALNIAEKNFNDIIDFPDFETLNAIKDDSLVVKQYKKLSDIYSNLSINICFLNNEIRKNQDSSFYNFYLNRTDLFIRNFQKNNVLSCIDENMFFHGDSINLSKNQQLINAGLSGIVFGRSENSDTSKYSIRNTVRKELKFGGLIFSNLANQKENITDTLLSMLHAGSDMFICSKPENFVSSVKYLLKEKKISEKEIDFLVRRVLLAKTWTNLDNFKELNYDSCLLKINNLQNTYFSDSLKQKSISLVKNNNFIPYKNLRNKSIELIVMGSSKLKTLSKYLNYYYPVNSQYIHVKNTSKIKEIKTRKKDVIIAFNNVTADTSILNKINKLAETKNITIINFGNLKNIVGLDSVKAIIQVYGNSDFEQQKVAEAIFGGIAISGQLPYSIDSTLVFGQGIQTKKTRFSHSIPEMIGVNSKILSKVDSIANNAIRRGVFPGCQVFVARKGEIIIDKSYGYHSYRKGRRVRNSDLYDIASITKIAATTLATMKMYENKRLRLSDKLGRFFRDKKIDYSSIKPDTIINIDTLKIAEIKDFQKLLKYQDTLHINDSILIAFDTIISRLTPRNNIFKVKIKELLVHKSGISPSLPIVPFVLYKKEFYKEVAANKKTVDSLNALGGDSVYQYKYPNIKEGLKEKFSEYYTRRKIRDSAEVQIAENMYLQNRYFDTLWQNTKRLKVYSRKIYKYADINMILLQQAIDTLNRRSIDRYLKQKFYIPMGLQTIGYHPRKRFSKNRIVPTENDKYWREQLLRGYVHDPSAALLGGVSGNAGLFSNAEDLATIGQMWLNEGEYGGVRFLSKNTVKTFTKRQGDGHRALGFDMFTKRGIISKYASRNSYGHTGFTGACIWVDPENELVYVFLSNRVHPSMKNWRINRLKIRQKIHNVVYEAIEE